LNLIIPRKGIIIRQNKRYQVKAYGKNTFRVFDSKAGMWASPGAFDNKRKAEIFARMCNFSESNAP